MKHTPFPKAHFKSPNGHWIYPCTIRFLTVLLAMFLSHKSSTARESVSDIIVGNDSFEKNSYRSVSTLRFKSDPILQFEIPLQISCPGVVESYGDHQQMVTDDFEDWKNGFMYDAMCKGEIDYYISYNGGTEFKEDPKNLTAPDFCSGDQIDVRMVVTSECENAECTSTFIVVVSGQSFDITFPAIDYGCFNGPVPPDKTHLHIFSREFLLGFAVPDPCIDLEEIEMTIETTGPFVQGYVYTFYTTYTFTAPNVNEIVTMLAELLWNPNGPVLLGVPADTTVFCDDLIPEMPVVTSYDLESGSLEVVSSSKTINSYCGKIIEQKWSARDNCGYTETAVQIIRVVDEIAPTLIVPKDLRLECDEAIPSPTYEASDNCSVYRVTFSEEKVVHNDCDYKLIRKWVASDKCNNISTATQIIEVLDTKSPEITLVNPMIKGIALGAEIPMYDCASNPAVRMDDVRISDCCDFVLKTADQLVSIGVCDIFGYYRKWRCSYTAVDPSGNTTEFYFFMVQYDTTHPTIFNVPTDRILACDDFLEPADTSVYAEDDCALNSHLKLVEQTIRDPNDQSKYAVIRTWTAEDHCQNIAEERQVIYVCGFDTNLMASSLGSFVWSDENQNGIQDKNEMGINNIKVNLYTYDTLRAERKYLSASARTRKIGNQDGQFIFEHLAPDCYVLEVVVPFHLKLCRMDAGADDLIDSDYSPTTRMTPYIHLLKNQQLMTYDAGLVKNRREETPSNLQSSGDVKVYEPDNDLDIRAFPNPFRDIFFLEFTSLQSNDVDVQIHNNVGLLVRSQILTSSKGFNQHQITMQGFPNGIYFLQVQIEDKTAYRMILMAN